MRKIVYTCDRCKKEVEGDPVKIHAKTVDRESGEFEVNVFCPEIREADFCKPCAEFFVGLVKKHCEIGIQDKPENKPIEKPRSKIDAGKIMALHKAGWKVKAISEEMACSEQTVYNVINKKNSPATDQGKQD